MRILSWNLFGLSDDDLDLRTEAAMFEALLGGRPEEVFDLGGRVEPPPEILMFQEVVERTYHAHLKPHLAAAGYAMVPAVPPNREYFEVLAVRSPLGILSSSVEPLDSAMGRELLGVEAAIGGRRTLWMTAHLESMKSGSDLRMDQARHVLDRLRAYDGPAVFAGDTNVRVAEATGLDVPGDAWEACGRDPRERWTRVSRRTGAKARYDRIWGRGCVFTDFRCVGRRPVTPSGHPPSDHFGVVARVRFDEPR